MLANTSTIKNENMSNKELANNYTSQFLESVEKEKYIHLLQTIFGAQI